MKRGFPDFDTAENESFQIWNMSSIGNAESLTASFSTLWEASSRAADGMRFKRAPQPLTFFTHEVEGRVDGRAFERSPTTPHTVFMEICLGLDTFIF